MYPSQTVQPCGFAGISCFLASMVFLKTEISVRESPPKLPAHLRPKSRPHCGRLASETPACGQVCGKMWLGWRGKAPALSPAHLSAHRNPSEIRPKPFRIAGAATVTLPRSCERTQRLTGANAAGNWAAHPAVTAVTGVTANLPRTRYRFSRHCRHSRHTADRGYSAAALSASAG